MPTKHTVLPGECISSIAFENGFFPDTIWQHADNAKLKEARKDKNTLVAGDIVVIPDKRLAEKSKPAGKRYRFKLKGVPEKLRVVLKDGENPRANLAYTLDVDGKVTKGRTDAKGRIEEWIAPGALKARIILPKDEVFELDLGHLAPVTEMSGVQGRLKSLGFYLGAVDGVMNPELQDAIRRFQKSQAEAQGRDDDKDVTGELDQATRDKIKQAFGG